MFGLGGKLTRGSGASGGGFYPTEIAQSLRFDGINGYLTRTPSVSGNRTTWTLSLWFKRCTLTGDTTLYRSYGTSGSTGDYIILRENCITFGQYNAGWIWQLDTVGTYRDPSAWYHVVLSVDTTQATASERVKIYINGERLTSFAITSYPSLNQQTYTNYISNHYLGTRPDTSSQNFGGYMAEVHFTDGTAYDASAFGEFKSGVWVAKVPSVTYGTNGFHLPFNSDYAVEGFNAVTWKSTASAQYIGGVGFQPDLVWVKSRSDVSPNEGYHHLVDSVRGDGSVAGVLSTNTTEAEYWAGLNYSVTSFENDGFTAGRYDGLSGSSMVAWCWDAGTGSPVSNTDGTITSTVKANTAQGFSIVSWTGTASAADTVGHGLNQAPEIAIYKQRNAVGDWSVLTTVIDGSNDYLSLNQTAAKGDTAIGGVSATTINNWYATSSSMIAYCFHSVSGYSDIGTYTGTNATGNVVTTGFKPAFVMVKRTNSTGNWVVFDSTRGTNSSTSDTLWANLANAEIASGGGLLFTDTGFSVDIIASDVNASGSTYLYMAFADTRDAGFFLDQSGNNNDWTPNVLTESDVMLDSPTNNFATWNVLDYNGGLIASEGNLRMTNTTQAQKAIRGTHAMTSGKWYFEVCMGQVNIYDQLWFGVLDSNVKVPSYGAESTPPFYGFQINWNNPSTSTVSNIIINGASGGSTWNSATVNGDVLSIAYDADSGKLWVGFKGVWLNNNGSASGGDPAIGTSPTMTFSLDSVSPYLSHYDYGSNTVYSTANFGQDSSFSGVKTPQGYTDANGIGDFFYQPPEGYLALCTSNLPEVAISPANEESPSDYFAPIIYTGDGTTDGSHAISVGFQPDLTWIKRRSPAADHVWYDSVRTLGVALSSSSTSAEPVGQNGMLHSFDADGFSVKVVSGDNSTNGAAGYASWNWKAGGAAVVNNEGDVTASVSANPTAGFSIISYTSGGNQSHYVGHGLNETPEFTIYMNRDLSTDKYVNTNVIDGSQDYLVLTTTASAGNSTASIANSTGISTLGWPSGQKAIAYAFHSVDGFSKVGKYIGNGSADGTFVYCGFKPSFVIMKRTDAGGNWILIDSARDTYNVADAQLVVQLSIAEATYTYLDFLSNGFKLRYNWSDTNANGGTYVYIAFAENPFKYTTAR